MNQMLTIIAKCLIPLGLIANIAAILIVTKRRFRFIETTSTLWGNALAPIFSILNLLFFHVLPVLQVFEIVSILPINTDNQELLRLIGLVLFLMGLLVLLAGRISLGQNHENGISPRARVDQELVRDGIYRFSRNPIYTGKMIMFVGYELAVLSYLFVLVIPLFLAIHHTVRREEKLLQERFGSAFESYRKQTRRYL